MRREKSKEKGLTKGRRKLFFCVLFIENNFMGGKTSKFGSQGPPEFQKNNGDNEKVLPSRSLISGSISRKLPETATTWFEEWRFWRVIKASWATY